MNFRKPVYVGDLVSVHATLVRIGRTSVTVRLEAWVLRRKEMQSILVTDGNFTYVSIDDHGHPQIIAQDQAPISGVNSVGRCQYLSTQIERRGGSCLHRRQFARDDIVYRPAYHSVTLWLPGNLAVKAT